MRPDTGGVMHVHGNVASGEEEAWARRLENELVAMAASSGLGEWTARVEHVERVKWYAPRVRHVVADVRCVPKSKSDVSRGRGTQLFAAAASVSNVDDDGGVGGAAAAAADGGAGGAGGDGAGEIGRRRGGGAASSASSASSAEERKKKAGKARVSAAGAGGEDSVPVRRMHRPTPADFRSGSGPASTREPCVLTGLDIGPAPWLWSPQHLASMPDVASADVSVHVSDTPHLDFVRKNFKFTNIPFGDLLASLAAETETEGGNDDDNNKVEKKKWYYLRSIGRNPRKEPAHALDQFPDLAKELKLPSDVLFGGSGAGAGAGDKDDDDDRYFSAVLRCSSGGLRLWTHYDAMDNALVQLHGEKRVLLYPPRAGAGLYLDGSSSPVVGLFTSCTQRLTHGLKGVSGFNLCQRIEFKK